MDLFPVNERNMSKIMLISAEWKFIAFDVLKKSLNGASREKRKKEIGEDIVRFNSYPKLTIRYFCKTKHD